MGQSRAMDRKQGTINNGADSKANWMFWDLSTEGRSEIILTVTTEVNMTLVIKEAASWPEIDTPPQGLSHTFTEAITANQTKRIVIPVNPGLVCGVAYLENASGGAGKYVMDGGRRTE